MLTWKISSGYNIKCGYINVPTFHRLQDQSLIALNWYRKGDDEDDIKTEFKFIKESNIPKANVTTQDLPKQDKIHSKIEIFAKKDNMKPFLIVISLLGLVPLTGIYRYYSTIIFIINNTYLWQQYINLDNSQHKTWIVFVIFCPNFIS